MTFSIDFEIISKLWFNYFVFNVDIKNIVKLDLLSLVLKLKSAGVYEAELKLNLLLLPVKGVLLLKTAQILL